MSAMRFLHLIDVNNRPTSRLRLLVSLGIQNTNKNFDISSDFYGGEAIPPGAYLKKELIARKFSQKEFARRLGMSSNGISEFINGKKTITAKTALQLEQMIPTRFWLYLQSDFQLREALIAKRSME